MGELGDTKVGPGPKNGILGQISQAKKSVGNFLKIWNFAYFILFIMTLSLALIIFHNFWKF